MQKILFISGKRNWKCDLVGFANRKKCSKARERNMHNSNMLHRGILYALLSRQGKWQKKLIGIYPLLSFVFQTSPENWNTVFQLTFLFLIDRIWSNAFKVTRLKIAPFEECAYKEILVGINRICNFFKTWSIRTPFYEKLRIPKPKLLDCYVARSIFFFVFSVLLISTNWMHLFFRSSMDHFWT